MGKGGAIRWTPEQLAEFESRCRKPSAQRPTTTIPVQPAPASRSKYGAEKIEQDGVTFDSGKEARRWAELQMLERAGQISDLKRQVPFVLAPAVRLAGEVRLKPALRYFADATYMQGGQLVVEDTKSEPTRRKDSYRIKKHLMATVHSIQIKEV
jgi:hypothetical protein